MSESPSRPARAQRAAPAPFPTAQLELRLADDPWSLTHDERRALAAAMAGQQAAWRSRLTALTEPPAPACTFPAFLLATAPFAHLAAAIGEARARADLDTGTADQLQRFTDLYRDYLLDDAVWTATEVPHREVKPALPELVPAR